MENMVSIDHSATSLRWWASKYNKRFGGTESRKVPRGKTWHFQIVFWGSAPKSWLYSSIFLCLFYKGHSSGVSMEQERNSRKHAWKRWHQQRLADSMLPSQGRLANNYVMIRWRIKRIWEIKEHLSVTCDNGTSSLGQVADISYHTDKPYRGDCESFTAPMCSPARLANISSRELDRKYCNGPESPFCLIPLGGNFQNLTNAFVRSLSEQRGVISRNLRQVLVST